MDTKQIFFGCHPRIRSWKVVLCRIRWWRDDMLYPKGQGSTSNIIVFFPKKLFQRHDRSWERDWDGCWIDDTNLGCSWRCVWSIHVFEFVASYRQDPFLKYMSTVMIIASCLIRISCVGQACEHRQAVRLHGTQENRITVLVRLWSDL